MRRRGRQRGFSLTELIISLGLFSIVLSMVFAFLDQTRRNLETESSGIETQQGARVAVEELAFHIRQAGYGIERRIRANPAEWQRAVIWAGAHAIAFNADLDPERGPIDSSTALRFPDGSDYSGEGPAESTTGAETYYFTIDADGDDTIAAADRWRAEAGGYNPAGDTDNPRDYALFRRTYGWKADEEPAREIESVTPFLFTNATAEDAFPDGTTPDPLFTYWLTEDLNGDGRLAEHECVVAPCPPPASRRPTIYLWGDDDFNGVLSEPEKNNLRSWPVGHPDWAANPLASGGELASTDLAAKALVGDRTLEIDNASGFVPGSYVRLGRGPSAERLAVASIDTSSVPDRIVLVTETRLPHVSGESIEVLPDSLLRAIRTVQIRFGAITPRRDFETAQARAASGRAGRVGTRGLDFRVLPFERRLGLPNLITRPVSR